MGQHLKISLVICLFLALASMAFVTGCADCDVATQPVLHRSATHTKSWLDETPISNYLHPDESPLVRLLGKWNGPEGTYLDIHYSQNTFTIHLKDTEKLRTFTAQSKGDHLVFERDGIIESVHLSTGDETGMKWLSGKQECVTVLLGEGYCRD